MRRIKVKVIAGGLVVDHIVNEIPWPHGELTPAADYAAESHISFPAVHQTDRATDSPDLSASISNTLFNPFWIKGGNKLCLPFIREE